MTGLNKTVVHWVVKPLGPKISMPYPQKVLAANSERAVPNLEHTGPVNTFADFVDHVPTSCVSIVAPAVQIRHAPAKSNDCSKAIVVVYEVGNARIKKGLSKILGCGLERSPSATIYATICPLQHEHFLI